MSSSRTMSVTVGSLVGLVSFLISGTAFYWLHYYILVYVHPLTVLPGCPE